MSLKSCSEPRDRDFEDSMYPYCTWLQAGPNDLAAFDWSLFSPSLPGLQFLPQFDHTFKNESGNYIYVTSKDQNSGDVVILFSETYPPTSDSGVCMTFFYQISGGLLTS